MDAYSYIKSTTIEEIDIESYAIYNLIDIYIQKEHNNEALSFSFNIDRLSKNVIPLIIMAICNLASNPLSSILFSKKKIVVKIPNAYIIK